MVPNSPSRHLLSHALGLISQDRPSTFPWHRLPPVRLLAYAYLSLLSLRFLFLSLALNNPSRYQVYLTFDSTMSHAANLISHQYIIALALVPGSLFILAEDYLLLVRPNTFYWALAREMLLTNSSQFWAQNSQTFSFQAFKWRHPHQSIRTLKAQILTFWNCKENPIFSEPLVAFPVLSPKERTRMVLFELIWNKVEFWILLNIALIQAIPFILGTLTQYQLLPLPQFTILLLDLISLYFIFLQLSSHLLFRVFLMFLDDYPSRKTASRLANNLRSLWKQCQSGRHPEPGAITQQLAVYRGAHWRLLHLVLRLNLAFASPFFAVAFLTNFPISICFQAELLQPNISPAYRALTGAFLVAQLSVSLLTINRMCARFEALYSSPPYLHRILATLRGGGAPFAEKWKGTLYYEQVHSRENFAFTAGPFGRITRESFASLILMDLVYVMNISKMMMET